MKLLPATCLASAVQIYLLAVLPSTLPAADAERTPAREAAGTITVDLASGRTFTAALDARTDPQQLWLRWQQGSAAVRRPISWDRVVRAHVAGRDLTGEELLGIVKAIRRDLPATPETAVTPQRIVLRGTPRAPEATTGTDAAASTAAEPLPVCSLAIEAELARWDAHVEADGLLVRVYPLDRNGNVTPVRGTLEVELIGRQQGGVKPAQPFSSIGQWTQGVSPADFARGGAAYRFAFQQTHPEFDLTLAPRGAVHARLSVPGRGTFEATAAMVRIRPYSSVRDELQQATGRRFFPQEATADGRR